MAKNIFMDSLNNRELMDAFGIQQDNAPMTPEELQALSEEQNQVEPPEVVPVMPENAMMETQNNPMTEEVSQNTPTVSNVPRNTMQDEKVNQDTPPTPRSRMETLLEEYNKLSREGMDEVKAARESDRMLKVGGALGDALATIINARSQMNVKAPGVQVQQGAGLGKIADMFATAPEVQSDIAERREALMEQYRQLARGEESAASKALRESQIDAYKARTKAQAERAKANIERQESREKLAQEREDRLARSAQLNAARGLLKDDPRAKKAVEQGMALESIEPLLKEIESGNEMAVQSLGTQLARAMGEVGVLTDTDVIRYVQGTSWGRKLKDWWARGAEGELPSEAIDGIRKNIKAINTNLTKNLDSVYSNAASRMKTAYPELEDSTIRGLLGTPAFKAEKTESKQIESNSKNVIIRRDPKSGRRVEYDAETKKPIRFLD